MSEDRRRDDDGGQQHEFVGPDTDDDVRDEPEHHTGGELVQLLLYEHRER